MEFPIAVLKTNDQMIYVYEDNTSLRKTSEEILSQNVWDNSDIIDSKGKKYNVLEVKKVGLRGLWGWNPLLKGKSIWVDYTFTEGKETKIDDFKSTIISKVKRKKEFWESAWDINELIEKIDNAKSFKEIIEFLK